MSPVERKFREDLVALLPRLRRFALALSRSTEAADELLHTALERGIRSSRSFDASRRLDSWMFAIIQNCWLNMRRDLSKRHYAPVDEWWEPSYDERDNLEARDELRRAARVFADLPEEQRAVLALVVLEGFSYKDASRALDVPIGTIMSRLARARAALVQAVRSDNEIRGVENG